MNLSTDSQRLIEAARAAASRPSTEQRERLHQAVLASVTAVPVAAAAVTKTTAGTLKLLFFATASAVVGAAATATVINVSGHEAPPVAASGTIASARVTPAVRPTEPTPLAQAIEAPPDDATPPPEALPPPAAPIVRRVDQPPKADQPRTRPLPSAEAVAPVAHDVPPSVNDLDLPTPPVPRAPPEPTRDAPLPAPGHGRSPTESALSRELGLLGKSLAAVDRADWAAASEELTQYRAAFGDSGAMHVEASTLEVRLACGRGDLARARALTTGLLGVATNPAVQRLRDSCVKNLLEPR